MLFEFETLIPSTAVAGRIIAMAKTAKHSEPETKAGRFIVKGKDTSKRRKSLIDLSPEEQEIISHNVKTLRGSRSRKEFSAFSKAGEKTIERLENKKLHAVDHKSLLKIAESAYMDVESLKSVRIQPAAEQPMRLLREILSIDPNSDIAQKIMEEHKRLMSAKR